MRPFKNQLTKQSKAKSLQIKKKSVDKIPQGYHKIAKETP